MLLIKDLILIYIKNNILILTRFVKIIFVGSQRY